MVPGLPDYLRRKFHASGLELLKADDVGLGFAKPAEQVRQATVDVVDVELAIFIGSGRRASVSTFALGFGPSPNQCLTPKGMPVTGRAGPYGLKRSGAVPKWPRGRS
jgi:hypothetical protein